MNNQVKIITIAVVGILIIFAVFRKKDSRMGGLNPEIESQGPSAPPPTPEVVSPENLATPSASKTPLQVVIQRDKMEKVVGLKRMALPVEGGEATLHVKITVKPACHPGDADAIIKDLKSEPSHKLLATLEDLSGNGKNFSWELPQSMIKDGQAEQTFKVPVKSDPAQYGFFICTAKKSDKTCSEKTLKDVNEIFTEHLTKQPNAGKEARNIFFQYFLVDERGLSTFNRVPKGPGNPAFDNLKKYIKEAKATGRPDGSELDLVKKGLKAVNSLPAVFADGTLVLELPKFKEAACLPTLPRK